LNRNLTDQEVRKQWTLLGGFWEKTKVLLLKEKNRATEPGQRDFNVKKCAILRPKGIRTCEIKKQP